MMQLPGIPETDSIHTSRHPSTTPTNRIATGLSERIARGTTRATAFRSTSTFMSTLKSVQRNKESKAMYSTSLMTSETYTTTDGPLATTGTASSSQSHVINRLMDVTNGSALEATTITSGDLSASSTPRNITYTSFPASSYSNCSAHFINYTQPQPGEHGQE